MASSLTCEKKVTFSEVLFTKGPSQQHELDAPSSDESFATREEEVLEALHLCKCNPALFSSNYVDPVERQSLLLLDKDLLDSDESAGLLIYKLYRVLFWLDNGMQRMLRYLQSM